MNPSSSGMISSMFAAAGVYASLYSARETSVSLLHIVQAVCLLLLAKNDVVSQPVRERKIEITEVSDCITLARHGIHLKGLQYKTPPLVTRIQFSSQH